MCSVLAEARSGQHISDVELEAAVSHTCGCWKTNSGPQAEQDVLLTAEPPFLFVKKIPLAYNWFFLNFPRGAHTHYIHHGSLISPTPPSPSARIKGMPYHAQCNRILSYICILGIQLHFRSFQFVNLHCFLKINIQFVCESKCVLGTQR